MVLGSMVGLLMLGGCGDDAASGGAGPSDPQFKPAPGGLRRLTGLQYIASVQVLLGDNAAAVALPPPDAQYAGSEVIAASELSLSPADVDVYEASAIAVASAAVADPDTRASIIPCTATAIADEACFEQIADRVGRLAWRRPITELERGELIAAGVSGATVYGTFDDGAKTMLSLILQSPDFLYQVELGDPHAADPTSRPLLPHELATRLSFFLVGETPDEALLDLADAGGLDTAEQVREVAFDLVTRPRAKVALGDFFSERFNLRDTASIQKNPDAFPLFTDATRAAIARETRLFLDEIVWTEDADALSIFDAPFTFVNEDNAWIYGLSVGGDEFQKVNLPGRSGVLTQPSFLARSAHPGETSPTRRGKYILEELLCQAVPPPPPGTSDVLPEAMDGDKTMRQRLAEVIVHAECRACHDRMDPIGLSLEHFDAVGVYRLDDDGLPLDTKGEAAGLAPFDGAVELGASIRGYEGAARCIVRHLYRQSMGHTEYPGEEPAIQALSESFVEGGHRIQSLLVEIATSPAFRHVGDPK